MADETVIVRKEELAKLVSTKMTQTGMPKKDADVVADVLVYADLRGVHSHGVIRVEHYMQRIRSGGMNLKTDFTMKRLKPSVALVDAKGAAGHVSMKYATEEAVKIAAEQGIALVGVKNNSHCGALAYYADIALKAKKAVLVCGNVNKLVVPFGGSEPFFGSNPMAFGFPGEKEDILLDMATSEVAWGKILTSREKNAPIPDNWAVDADGKKCTDPQKAVALLPFGGPKGYGITVMVEALTGLLVGGVFGPHVKQMYGDYDKYRDLSNLLIVIDPAIFWGGNGYLKMAQTMIDEIHRIPPAPGFEKVLVPGEIENKVMARYTKDGIPVPKSIYEFLTK
ncbi:MAG: ureidoglycolate dehydrogenase [Treponemataceae bacterium]